MPNSAIVLLHCPAMVEFLEFEAKVVCGNNPVPSAIELDGIAKRSADFIFAWHKNHFVNLLYINIVILNLNLVSRYGKFL